LTRSRRPSRRCTERAQLDEEPEPAKQAATADRLLLTKTDLANAAEIVRLCERLRGLNLGARLHTVLHGEIDPEKLFGAGLFDPAGKPPDVRAWINEPAYDGASGSHQHHHGDGVHDARVRAFCLSFDVPLEWGALSEWLARSRELGGSYLPGVAARRRRRREAVT